MNDYETRKLEKIERYRELADKNKTLAESTLKHAHDMADTIPFGQPILVGHHSEGRDRNFRERIHNTYEKAWETKEKADYYEHKANTVESNRAISSDDPEAVTKLKTKIAAAEVNQKKMRDFNKCLRAKDNAGMLALGFNQAMIDTLSKPDFCGRVGFADYAMTNNNGNIHRMKERLAQLEKHSTDTTTETVKGDIRILENVELNRLQIFFPGKPSDEIRSQLKSWGFRWSPTEGAWQRQRSNGATYAAKHIIEKIGGESVVLSEVSP
jgi:hypothetical protein